MSSFLFSDYMSESFKSFDSTKSEGILIGEMIWNFADFMTKQEVTNFDMNSLKIRAI